MKQGVVGRLDRYQVAMCLAALAAGAGIGLAAPAAGHVLEPAINPVLGALLYATFLQVPAGRLLNSLRDGRFIAAALVVNFVAVPLVVAAMFGFLPADQPLRLGVLLVLLCPCVDYVIVFSGLAGGDRQRLLAATPLLLLVQMLLLPLLLLLFMGSSLASVVRPGPFVAAFVGLIVIPLALAWLTQAWAARHQVGARFAEAMTAAPVPSKGATMSQPRCPYCRHRFDTEAALAAHGPCPDRTNGDRPAAPVGTHAPTLHLGRCSSDMRRGLPVPPVSLHPDPVTGVEDVLVDFTTVNMATSTRLAAARECSLCAQPIGYWVAFIGGTWAAELMRYTDPPTCPPCAHAAIRLCLYIAVGRHRRARADRPGAGIVPPGASPTKPDAWVIGITRQYRTEFLPAEGFTVYPPARFRTIHTYQYGPDGRINPEPTTRPG